MILTPVANLASNSAVAPNQSASYAFINNVAFERSSMVNTVIDGLDFYEDPATNINIGNNGVSITATYEVSTADLLSLPYGMTLDVRAYDGYNNSATQLGIIHSITRSSPGPLSLNRVWSQTQITDNIHIQISLKANS